MELEGIYGLMVGNTVDNGRMIKCMVKGYFNGETAECIMVNIQMIKKMVVVFSNGRIIYVIIFRPEGRKYVGYWSDGK